MRKALFALVLVAFGPMLIAQHIMNNDAIIKLCKAGLSDELIVSTINSSPGNYDTSPDGIIALKSAGASDKVVAAVVGKGTADKPAAAEASDPAAGTAPVAPASSEKQKPRVFLRSSSHGNARNQSMEMSKDFEKDCPDVKLTVSQSAADYFMILNHIEKGWSRDNQVQIANKDGDLISKTKEGGSISSNVKKACELILEDWAKK
jgi:hypothetical protein